VLTEEETQVYSQLFVNMSRDVMYPSAVIYLDCDPEVARKRIEKRGRECEKGVSIEYLAALKMELDALVEDFCQYTTVRFVPASADLTPDEIASLALREFLAIKSLRRTPILSRMGV
jgi:deoxyadenosine/deoxycytidine kinase